MAGDSNIVWNGELGREEGEEAAGLLQRSREGSPDEETVAYPQGGPQRAGPRRQSSFAKPRENGTPRTLHRVRFDVEGRPSETHEQVEDALADGWLEEDDFLTSDAPTDSRGQRAPLLTNIEAPSVTLANEDPDFNIEDLLESSRPKSGMKSAFMNMANSIMYVAPSRCLYYILKLILYRCSGAGIIGQPYAFKQAGLLTGIVLLIALTVTVDWTIRLIVTNSKLSGADSFQATMEHCYGKSGLVAISVAQWAL